MTDQIPRSNHLGLPEIHPYHTSLGKPDQQERVGLMIGEEAFADHWKEGRNDLHKGTQKETRQSASFVMNDTSHTTSQRIDYFQFDIAIR